MSMARWALLGALLALGVSCVACGGGGTPPPAPTRVIATGSVAVTHERFPHALHTGDDPQIRGYRDGQGLRCDDCHSVSNVKAGAVARPGGQTSGPSAQQHAPCDECHRDEFAKPPGPLCKICHESVDPMVKGSSVLKPFPAVGVTVALASSFSHRIHLDADAMESAVGAHVTCTDCHTRDPGTGDPMLPSHKQCVPCHAQAKAAVAALPMENCAGCHLQRVAELKRGRIFITGDLKFSHQRHERDRAGAPIACATCHDGVRDSKSREDMAVPAMERCAQCHQDERRTSDRVRMSNCKTCHSAIGSGTAPTNHQVTGALPTDHTLEFRRHHAAQAADKEANCGFCHQVSGRHEDSCMQCHLVMRPHDHNLMFRDDHGREAEVDGNRCASCHTPETCIACHSVPPRSHSPLADFAQGGHAEQARFNLTSCLTCHTYATTCAQCHRDRR